MGWGDNHMMNAVIHHLIVDYQKTVRPHLSTSRISSSLAFHKRFYWKKFAIILLYTVLLLPHLSSSLAFLTTISSRTDVSGQCGLIVYHLTVLHNAVLFM